MENLIIPCKSRPPELPTHLAFRQEVPLENPNQHRPVVSLPRRNAPRSNFDSNISHLCRKGEIHEAVELLGRVRGKVRPSTYEGLLDACIDRNSIGLGRKLHSLVDLVVEADGFVQTKLVGMYAKCGSLDDARKVFDGMRDKDLYAWSAMVGACSRAGRWEEVVELFVSMVRDSVLFDGFLLPKILQACGNSKNISVGKVVHSLAIRRGMCTHVRVCNSVLTMYAKCGDLKSAHRAFDCMDERDDVTWNALISGHCHQGNVVEARKLFDAMRGGGLDPTSMTWNLLISGYSQLGNWEVAVDLMRKMEDNGIAANVFTWTCLISGCGHNGQQAQALDLFRMMLIAAVEPNRVTLACVISACASLQTLNRGIEVHSLAVTLGMADHVLVGNSLIDLYAKCGDVKAAEQVFDAVSEKDLYTWNSMIGGYFQAGYSGKAHELFTRMMESGVECNVITWNVMISGYMKNGDDDQAINLFRRMEKEKIKPNTATWNSLIAGYAHNGEKDKALGVFRQMHSCGVPLNSVTILSLLPSLANLISLNKVEEVHGCALRRDLDFVTSISNSLIDAYAKAGKIEYSLAVHETMSSRDVITWNSMLGGFVLHGHDRSAIKLFRVMRNQGCRPTRGTFVSLLKAYGLAGMVDDGKRVFTSISEEHSIMPAVEHYLSMVELYGRAGRLSEALEFIENMPVEPDASIWMAFFTACRFHKNVSLALAASENLVNLEPSNGTFHDLLEQASALCGGTLSKGIQKDQATQRLVGRSWTVIDHQVHEFTNGNSDQHSELHPLLKRIDAGSREFEPLPA
ncbi:hypothetical protein MLD38_024789 [Melastoma candidum]|uniref:Uncharacterized protein n=1 Tax=Melastoma candidum TaxID=119954 RepID=A0ACB9NWF7_9MYRT|nr:hypothetical protein MLD38_024789 [Melastoma candidum]